VLLIFFITFNQLINLFFNFKFLNVRVYMRFLIGICQVMRLRELIVVLLLGLLSGCISTQMRTVEGGTAGCDQWWNP